MNQSEPPSRQGAKRPEPTAAEDRVARVVVDAAFTVHSVLGPGLLESVYEQCLGRELALRSMCFERQARLPLIYKGVAVEAGFRIDMVVESTLAVEIKAVESLLAVHRAQLLTYLKLSGYRIGLLINFNVPIIKNGIVRVISQ